MWLTKTIDIQQASEEDLLRSLLTDDGMGAKFKAKCLDEILRRKESYALSISQEITKG